MRNWIIKGVALFILGYIANIAFYQAVIAGEPIFYTLLILNIYLIYKTLKLEKDGTQYTNKKCKLSGGYGSYCEHRMGIYLEKGDKFPKCDYAKPHIVKWKFISELENEEWHTNWNWKWD